MDPPVEPAPDFDPGSAGGKEKEMDPPVKPADDEEGMMAGDEGAEWRWMTRKRCRPLSFPLLHRPDF